MKINKEVEKKKEEKKSLIEKFGKTREIHKTRRLSLTDLPTEILEMTINKVSMRDRFRIRRVCKRLRDVCDSALMHNFQVALHKYGKINPSGIEFPALQVKINFKYTNIFWH